MAAKNALMQVKKSDLSAEILQSEQSFFENKYAIFVPLRGTQTWRLHTKPYEFE